MFILNFITPVILKRFSSSSRSSSHFPSFQHFVVSFLHFCNCALITSPGHVFITPFWRDPQTPSNSIPQFSARWACALPLLQYSGGTPFPNPSETFELLPPSALPEPRGTLLNPVIFLYSF